MTNAKTSVECNFWDYMEGDELTSTQRYLALALVTIPQRSLVGIYSVTDKMLASYMGVNVKTVQTAMKALESKGYVVRIGNEVFVPTILRNNPPAGGDTYKYYLHDFNAIRSEELVDKLIESCREYINCPMAAALLDCKFCKVVGTYWTPEQFDKARNAHIRKRTGSLAQRENPPATNVMADFDY